MLMPSQFGTYYAQLVENRYAWKITASILKSRVTQPQKDVPMKLIFSQNSIFHLYRLSVIVSHKTEKKYRLSNEEELHSLIRYCNRSENTTICRQYDTFLHSLEPDILMEIEQMTGNLFEEVKVRLAG